ncbi:GtrA family protein [Allorhizobium sp. BGMRC 0089]|uniref:GtrA family protein n=1 Tax=Allorhizobium sonneratiae TaxID=2934936 RepID=UPI0020334D8D|nr:GtrA family protein [Allorhizobium sonneratiae]MCM2291713.1 GtrA family protein [Allorhizobium sonneratiae]
MKKLFRFACVGSFGFVIDVSLFFLLLHHTGVGPFAARGLAIAAATMIAWLLNRRFTFGASKRAIVVEGFRYGSVGSIAALVNFGLYSGLLLAMPALNPYAALIIASLSATALSYIGYGRFVFR